MKFFLIFILLIILPFFESYSQLADREFYGIINNKLNNKEVGGVYYNKKFLDVRSIAYDYQVSNIVQLRVALKKARHGQTIYLDEGGDFNMTNKPTLKISSGISLISGRRGQEGARLYITNYRETPIFTIAGTEVKISGLLIEGPDMSEHFKPTVKIQPRREKMLKERSKRTGESYESLFKRYKEPRTKGIYAEGAVSFRVTDCELRGWTHAAIMINSGAYGLIDFNYIHGNKHYGLGYGISVNGGKALIQGNYFNNNRHSIASSGVKGSEYEASYNKVGPDGIAGHAFDVHGGVDRGDGTNIAGTRFKIHNNEFNCSTLAIRVRGKPLEVSEIYNNIFISEQPNFNGVFFRQTNGSGNVTVTNNKYIYNNKNLIQ